MFSRRLTAALGAAALSAPLLLAGAAPAGAASPAKDGAKLARELVRKSSAGDAYKHLKAFQRLADRNGGHRAAGSPGYEASAAYVHRQLKRAGYDVSYDYFDFTYSETLKDEFSVVSPEARDIEIHAMTFSKSTPEGGLDAPLAAAPVDADGTSGCEPGDFADGDYTGKVALVQRGGCNFVVKQANAADAGAVATVIFNNAEGALAGTLGDPEAVRVPTGGISRAEGEALLTLLAQGEVTVHVDVQMLVEPRTTRNVIAETRRGAEDRTVMLGAHLDSVPEGPGINDNASGSAALLEVAKELAKAEKKPRNRVRFAFWSAEELSLVGSSDYVSRLTPRQLRDIELYLNFDMVASPNYGLFVYDGDDSDGVGEGPGPEGSAQLERQITDFMDRRGLPHEGTDFTGRSDYGPFIEVGIPSGGTFTGAEGTKTEAQAVKFGGTAGVAYDPCYHAACDDLDNISMPAFDANIDVIANAVGTYAHDVSSLREPVSFVPTEGDEGSGGGAHDHHAER
ncbi:M28 family metallopeptidase [Streptomyces synnematoformans]|uniref:M28 family metallopeptidase n=1 Tax=Streptomyces synnematoformans TaxID=415721 RepID=A0ABN2XJ72_9ACTN